MSNLIIRSVTLDDIDKIHCIHQGEEDPWADPGMCRSWVSRRLGRPFYIQVAELDGTPAGHGEWIVSDEPSGRTFYLGQLQIAKALQRAGIGRAMLRDGEAEARRRGCPTVTTIPEPGTDAYLFYEKCGYRVNRRFISAEADVAAKVKPEAFTLIDEIPENAVHDQPFLFGLAQSAAQHMWEVISRLPDASKRNVKCAAFPDGSYAALSWFDSQPAFALAFGHIPPDTAAGHCFTLADACGLSRLELEFEECHKPLLTRFNLKETDHFFEMIKMLD